VGGFLLTTMPYTNARSTSITTLTKGIQIVKDFLGGFILLSSSPNNNISFKRKQNMLFLAF
jgi:hypothetical protein